VQTTLHPAFGCVVDAIWGPRIRFQGSNPGAGTYPSGDEDIFWMRAGIGGTAVGDFAVTSENRSEGCGIFTRLEVAVACATGHV